MNKNLQDLNDFELIMLYHEEDELAKNLLFMKYKPIIDILISKYRKIINANNIDYQEVYSECTVGFSDAIKSYQDDKKTTLPTFITICIERRIIALIRKYGQEKYRIYNESYSLDYVSDNLDKPAIELISDDKQPDPLNEITDIENYQEFVTNMKKILTKKEYEVFTFMLRNFNYQEIARILGVSKKQVDNTIQRIKNKIREFLNKEKAHE